MSKRMIAPVALTLALASGMAACSGNPLGGQPEEEPSPTETGEVVEEAGGVNDDVKIYAETTTGDGFVKNMAYNAASDTYSVDNLAFDGDNFYGRSSTSIGGGAAGKLSSFDVYEPARTITDPVNGIQIDQFEHRMLAGISTSGATSFSIVRTGAYKEYGFGGFLVQRQGGTTSPTTWPTTGQAAYTGDYAGLRDFDGRSAGIDGETLQYFSGLQYTSGKAELFIDFDDFNEGDAVRGYIGDRQIYDTNGTNITSTILDAMGAKYGIRPTILPTLTFAVGPNTIARNGQMTGTLDSTITAINPTTGRPYMVTFEDGTYYGVMAGGDATGPSEIVGIIVVEGEDPTHDAVTVRETGGFIAYRNP